ncbi:Cytosolic copper metallochaperone [Emydomyces testavorans]|uniref:Cytosolic copper metallochaperone n=1 Tax=Emydomyces testavorans TaxID=2070801 RepID=A0AAF0IGB5_9EURO|nr:Cytosolic copper metallochaperone [Emydomyces testavorans]
MSKHQYKFNVTMSCSGCSGAVERVLKKLEGVVSYEVSLESQTATVVTEPTVEYDTVLNTIKKTGKTVTKGEADGTEMAV